MVNAQSVKKIFTLGLCGFASKTKSNIAQKNTFLRSIKMLIVIEGPHNTGKSGVAKRISEEFDIPIWPSLTRHGDIQVDKNDDEFSVATSAINATLGKVLSMYPNTNFIMDRFHVSAKVYANFYGRRKTNFDFIDDRFKDDALLICLSASGYSMMQRGIGKERNKDYTFDDCTKLDLRFKGECMSSKIKKKIFIDTNNNDENKVQKLAVEFIRNNIT